MKVGNGKTFLGDTLNVMEDLIMNEEKVKFVLTSPPYNMRGHEKEMYNDAKSYRDNKTNEEYRAWIISLFDCYHELLDENGVVLFNLNYISNKKNNASNLFKTIVEIEEKTPFVLIDQICWKKDTAMPISEARLSRVWENIWVFIRKKEWETFHKKYKKTLVGKPNFIVAPNNDGTNDMNKACFSSSLVEQLLTTYGAQKGDVVLDNFMGTHTTAIGCEKKECKWIGIEIDEETFTYGCDRVNTFLGHYEKIKKHGKNNLFNITEE
jgi:DNA modification methylase